jgi:hypothetical protein
LPASPPAAILSCTALLLCLAWPALELYSRLAGGDAASGNARFAGQLLAAGAGAAESGVMPYLRQQLAWIVGFWALCVVALTMRMGLGLLWIGRVAGKHGTDPQWQARLSRLAGQFGVVVEILLFYHPVVWWISGRIRIEREQIADDLAARQLGEPRRLALALSELERFQFSTHHLAQAANGGDLMSRINRLIRPDTAMNWKATIPVLGLAAACLAAGARRHQAVHLQTRHHRGQARAELDEHAVRLDPRIERRNIRQRKCPASRRSPPPPAPC